MSSSFQLLKKTKQRSSEIENFVKMRSLFSGEALHDIKCKMCTMKANRTLAIMA